MNILNDIQDEFLLKTKAIKSWIYLGLQWNDIKRYWRDIKKAITNYERNKKRITNLLKLIKKNWGKRQALIFQLSAKNKLKQI